MVLFTIEEYRRTVTELVNLGNADERLKALAYDFHGKAAPFGLELHHYGTPEGELLSVYEIEFYYPEQEGGVEGIAHIAENDVQFSFFQNGEVVDEYPHDKDKLVWILWGAMNLALGESASKMKP